MKIFGPEAYANAAKSENARWESVGARAGEGAPFPVAHTPKFQLSAQHRFFCIGSCFARSIERALTYRGVDVMSQRMLTLGDETKGAPSSIANKFTTHSIANEVRWAISRRGGGMSSLLETPEGAFDLQLSPSAKAVSFERAQERRTYMESNYFARLAVADVVIMTLGLVETWRDEAQAIWLNRAPPFSATRAAPQRYSVTTATTADNIAALEEARDALVKARPGLKIVVTVSPVPLSATFTGVDIYTANTRSKSTLRAAAAEFSDAHDDVAYFPSYEMVMGAGRAAFAPDTVHVRTSVVERVVGMFCDLYIPDAPAPVEGFHEALYLRANPDVRVAVRAAELSSGFEHWMRFGKAEGRPLRPDEIPDKLYFSGLLDEPEADVESD